MRERLGDREAPLGGAKLAGEEDVRELVPAPRPAAERRLGLVEPLAVVLDDLAGATGRVVDRLAVPGQSEPRRELEPPAPARP